MADLAPGTQLGKYTIEALAGRGGMGVVYKARQQRPARTVALKVIAPDLAQDQGFRTRFERESEIAAQIEHPNVIPVHEVDEHDGLLYLTMRYVEGGTDLRQLILRHGRLPARRAAEIVAQVASALDAAHRRGLVHRDIKPANVLIADDDGRDHAYLTDFGLTKQSTGGGDGLTQTGMFVGTLDYIAPEQLEGKDIDARTDVYALGCVLFQAVTGRVPYQRDTDVQKMFAHMNEPPPSATTVTPEIPPALDAVIARAMAKKPQDRFATAGELGRAALAAVDGAGGAGAAAAGPELAKGGPPAGDATALAAGATAFAGGAPATAHAGGAPPTAHAGAVSPPYGQGGPASPGGGTPIPGGAGFGGPAGGGGAPGAAPRRRRGLLVGGALAALALVVVLVVVMAGGGDGDGPSGDDRQAAAQVVVDYFARTDPGVCDLSTDDHLLRVAQRAGAPAGDGAQARQSCVDNTNGIRGESATVTIDALDLTGDRATANVTAQDGTKIRVDLVQRDGRWLIDGQA